MRRGWFGESYRHYLASKGVSSGPVSRFIELRRQARGTRMGLANVQIPLRERLAKSASDVRPVTAEESDVVLHKEDVGRRKYEGDIAKFGLVVPGMTKKELTESEKRDKIVAQVERLSPSDRAKLLVAAKGYLDLVMRSPEQFTADDRQYITVVSRYYNVATNPEEFSRERKRGVQEKQKEKTEREERTREMRRQVSLEKQLLRLQKENKRAAYRPRKTASVRKERGFGKEGAPSIITAKVMAGDSWSSPIAPEKLSKRDMGRVRSYLGDLVEKGSARKSRNVYFVKTAYGVEKYVLSGETVRKSFIGRQGAAKVFS